MGKYKMLALKCTVSCAKVDFETAEKKYSGRDIAKGLEQEKGKTYNAADILNNMKAGDITFEDAEEWEEFEVSY